jgi:hypothetical protein
LTNNGQVEPDGNSLPWRLPKSKAVECDASMKARWREKLVAESCEELSLGKSLRVAAIGGGNRRKLTEAFVDTRLVDGDYEMFRAKARGYGVPLIVIVLVLGIVWDILLEIWRRRNPKGY